MNTLSIILPFHIIIALSSLFYTAYEMFRPSRFGLKICYLLLALVIISGTGLIILKPAHMTQTCVEGLTFVGFMLAGIFVIRHRLAA